MKLFCFFHHPPSSCFPGHFATQLDLSWERFKQQVVFIELLKKIEKQYIKGASVIYFKLGLSQTSWIFHKRLKTLQILAKVDNAYDKSTEVTDALSCYLQNLIHFVYLSEWQRLNYSRTRIKCFLLEDFDIPKQYSLYWCEKLIRRSFRGVHIN